MRTIRFSPSTEVVAAERPVPGPGQLLVRTELIGVHLGLVRTLHADNVSEPGAEVVGTVEAVGADVAPGWMGLRVGGVVLAGAYAEYVLAAPALMTEIPVGVTAADALAVVRGGLIALGALRAGRFAAGESILINGAASGVGHLAVQLARTFGASRIVAAAGSAAKAPFLLDCGADTVVTYTSPWPQGVDVVLDGVGGDQAQRGVDALAPYGRLVAYSAGGGEIAAGSLLAQLKTVTGFSAGLLSRSRPELIADYRTELWKLLLDGKIRPHHTVYAWDRIAEAMESVESRRNQGRVAVRTGDT